jgi:hypothetical protein
VRLRPERANHVWAYDFVKAMTHDGRALRLLVLLDEYTRECLAIRVARRLGSLEVRGRADLHHGPESATPPKAEYICADHLCH